MGSFGDVDVTTSLVLSLHNVCSGSSITNAYRDSISMSMQMISIGTLPSSSSRTTFSGTCWRGTTFKFLLILY